MNKRKMTDTEIENLIYIFNNALSSQFSKGEVEDALIKFEKIEKNINGRICGDIHDLLINYLSRMHAANILPGDDYFQCEIGVLFGGSLIFGLGANKTGNKVIAIDPLEGYYMNDPDRASEIDQYSGVRVDKSTLKGNLKIFGYSLKDISLIREYSNTESCKKEMENKALSFLFIDGDHTYEGIMNDWIEYSSLVVDNGLVVIDNINDWPWIDVNLFCHWLIKDLDGWGLKVYYNRTIVLQKNVSHEPIAYEAFKSTMNFSLVGTSLLNATKAENKVLKKELNYLEKHLDKFKGLVKSPAKLARFYFHEAFKSE